MAIQLALLVAGAVLASAPGNRATPPPAGDLSHAESFSLSAGRALGAAASCGTISGNRIDQAAQRLGAAIERLAPDAADRGAAQRRLIEGVSEGGSAVELGALDCARAEQALAQIERQLRQMPPGSLRITGP